MTRPVFAGENTREESGTIREFDFSNVDLYYVVLWKVAFEFKLNISAGNSPEDSLHDALISTANIMIFRNENTPYSSIVNGFCARILAVLMQISGLNPNRQLGSDRNRATVRSFMSTWLGGYNEFQFQPPSRLASSS